MHNTLGTSGGWRHSAFSFLLQNSFEKVQLILVQSCVAQEYLVLQLLQERASTSLPFMLSAFYTQNFKILFCWLGYSALTSLNFCCSYFCWDILISFLIISNSRCIVLFAQFFILLLHCHLFRALCLTRSFTAVLHNHINSSCYFWMPGPS